MKVTAARVDANNLTHKKRISIVSTTNEVCRKNHGREMPDDVRERNEEYRAECERELREAKELVDELRVKFNEAQKTLRSMGVKVMMRTR